MIDNRTQEILKLFQSSWIETKARFIDLLLNHNFEARFTQPFIDFIDQMIENGEDKFFRAGTFMHDLSISRSVSPRLRNDQKYIRIEICEDDFIVALNEGKKEYRSYRIKTFQDEKFINLLETLKHTLVD